MTVTSYVNQTVTQRVTTDDGKVADVTKTVTVPVTSTVLKVWNLKKAKITDARGKKIDLDDLRKRLASETPVVVSADGKPIAKGYRELMKPEVIVIEAPLLLDPPPLSK